MAPRAPDAHSGGAVAAVRVLLDDIPPLLRSIIVDALAERADIELIAGDAATQPDPSRVDVVLTGASDPHDASRAARLLSAWPSSRILLVASSGRQAVMYELYPRKLVLGDVSPSALVNAMSRGFGAEGMPRS